MLCFHAGMVRALPYIMSARQKIDYRIQNADGTFLNAGTGIDSWFTLETARGIVNYDQGQKIVESDGINILWEVL